MADRWMCKYVFKTIKIIISMNIVTGRKSLSTDAV